MIELGYCKDCAWFIPALTVDDRGWDLNAPPGCGICDNKKKILELGHGNRKCHDTPKAAIDILAYEWDESGSYFVGPRFGCVHFFQGQWNDHHTLERAKD